MDTPVVESKDFLLGAEVTEELVFRLWSVGFLYQASTLELHNTFEIAQLAAESLYKFWCRQRWGPGPRV